MKLFKKKGEQGKQQIKAGDYVVIRGKHWDDKTKWVAQTRYIFKVLSVKDGEIIFRYEWSDKDETADIRNCVKIPKEEVERYCEIKGSKGRVEDFDIGGAKEMPEAAKKIKIGDTINTNYNPDYRCYEKYYNKYDYTVLGLNDKFIACTRLNKNQDLYIFPRETCYIKGEEEPLKVYRPSKKGKKREEPEPDLDYGSEENEGWIDLGDEEEE